jgi:hypothetical protein
MSARRLSALVDALADGRRPGRFEADPGDVDVLRTAITLRAGRPGDAYPNAEFVSGLYEELNDQMDSGIAPLARPSRRRRVALAAAAAGLVLMGGATAATEFVSQGPVAPAALQAPHGAAIRTGTFESVDGRVMGQIVAYRGNPSWVLMNVDGSGYTGAVSCTLQVANGSTVATGAFTLVSGKGEWSKTIHIDIGRLRGANLLTQSGAIVASATFA